MTTAQAHRARPWRLVALGGVLLAGGLLVLGVRTTAGPPTTGSLAAGSPSATSPLSTTAAACGELTADVPDDLAQQATVDEVVASGPAGRRVTYHEPALLREVSLATGSEPIAFDHGEPAGTRRSATTVSGLPAERVDLANGDRFVHWQDPSAPPGCAGRSVAIIGLSDVEAERVLATVAVVP